MLKNLTPPERLFLITHNLALYRDLHHLNRLLTVKGTSQHSRREKLPSDLRFLKVNPQEEISKQFIPTAQESYSLFSSRNRHFFAHMLPKSGSPMSEQYKQLEAQLMEDQFKFLSQYNKI